MSRIRFSRFRTSPLLAALLLLLMAAFPAAGFADRYNFVDDPRYDRASNRWGSAADRIDEYLDQAFGYYLAGNTGDAYDCVNNAYFCVYETTGFERQTMSYISGPRKNAVELEFTTCKKAVKNTALDEETQKSVRTELNTLKAMIREDANKLAALMDPPQQQTVTTYWQDGVQVEFDPWAELAGEAGRMKYRSWTEAADAITDMLETAETAYNSRDYEAALDNVNTAYFSIYEETGFDRKIYTTLSAEERLAVDDAFTAMRAVPAEAIQTGKYKSNPWKTARNALRNAVRGAAARIDELEPPEPEESVSAADDAAEKKSPGWYKFTTAFGILLREGLEAILVIAAIIAYLKKSRQQMSLRPVYIGALAGIGASVIAAVALYFIKQAAVAGGMAQEIIEGITALIAVCVLFYVSNWMISKSEAAAWTGYIDRKVQGGVERRSSLTLAFTAFLAVFREGAEVVLFYQPLLIGEDATHVNMVIWGFLAACAVLVVVYIIITRLSVRLPIKVFFTATSILMAIMCVAFLGSGIKELAEGGVFEVSARVDWIPESEVLQTLGIYPYLETLAPQLLLTVILIVTFLIAHYRAKLEAQKKDYEARLTAALNP